MAEVGCLKDKCLQNLQVEGNTVINGNIKGLIPIRTVKAITDASGTSHPLTPEDAGLVNVSAVLAAGSVIKLPAATPANVGLYYKIIFTAAMAGAAKIQLPQGGTATFEGVVVQERCGTGAGVAEHATNVRATTLVPDPGAEQCIELDENDVTFGGGVGTHLEFYYVSTTQVFVTGRLLTNVATSALDGLTASTFTATGY